MKELSDEDNAASIGIFVKCGIQVQAQTSGRYFVDSAKSGVNAMMDYVGGGNVVHSGVDGSDKSCG